MCHHSTKYDFHFYNLKFKALLLGLLYKEFHQMLRFKSETELEYHLMKAEFSICPRRPDFHCFVYILNTKKKSMGRTFHPNYNHSFDEKSTFNGKVLFCFSFMDLNLRTLSFFLFNIKDVKSKYIH